MSSIDNRIVQMEFDNKQFEAGVQTTLKSLENLKNGLDLKGATNGIKNIEKAVSGFDMSGMGKAVDSIAQHFTWFGRTIDHEIDRITSRAIAAGEQMIKSLSIDQVTVGWNKFEDKTRSVATIMNATGKSVDEVNESLEKLNWFTDETSYNFTDMVNNVGKFTSVGVKLDDAVTAMQGIANAAALSGGGIGEASRAMYNFSQAMGTGKLLLQDWKSIELANMATTDFKQTLLDSGLAMGTLKKKGDEFITVTKDGTGAVRSFKDVNEGFRDSLASGWITTDVMMDTFKKYGQYADEIYKITERDGITAAEAMEKFSDKSMVLGERAFKAAQEARTFTDAINATKDAVSTGWMQSFEIIFGNYEQAKTMWTDLANTLWDVFAGGAEARNDLLKETFQEAKDIISLEDWNKIADDLPFTDTLRKAILDTAREHGIAIDHIYTDEAAFITLLSQGQITTDMFNEALTRTEGAATEAGSGVSDATSKLKELEDIAKKVIHGDFGNGDKRIEALTKAGYDYKEVQGLVNKLLKGQKIAYEDLSDEQLKQVGYTDEEIEQLKALKKAADEAGTPLNDFLTSLYKPTGRELMIEAASNAFQALMKVIETLKDAWRDVFPAMTADRLYDIIEKIRDFTSSLMISDEIADKLKRTFRGVFSVFDILKQALSSIIRFFGKILEMLKPVGDWLLDTGAKIGDFFYDLSSKTKESKIFDNTLDKILEILTDFSNEIGSFFSSFGDVIGNTFHGIFSLINGRVFLLLQIFTGLLGAKFLGSIAKVVTRFGNTFKGLDKILRSSGKVIQNVAKGISYFGKAKLREANANLIFKTAAAIGILVYSLDVLSKINPDRILPSLIVLGVVAGGLIGFFNILKNIKGSFKGASSLLTSSISILIFVESMKKISQMDYDEIGRGLVGLGGLLTEIAAFTRLASKKIKITNGIGLIGMATSMLLFGKSLAQIGSLDFETIKKGLIGLAGLLTEVILFTRLASKKIKITNGIGLMAISTSVLLFGKSLAQIGSLDFETIKKGLIGLAGLLTEVILFTRLASKKIKITNGIGLIGMATSMLLFGKSLAQIGSLDLGTIGRGLIGLAGLLTEVILFTRLASKKIKITNGIGLIGIATSMILFAKSLTEIGSLDFSTIGRSLIGLAGLLTEVILFTRLASKKIKITSGIALIAISASMVLFAKSLTEIGSLDFSTIGKGILGLFGVMLTISKFMNATKGMKITSSIGLGLAMMSLIALIPLFQELSRIEEFKDVGIGLGIAIAGLGIGFEAFSKVGGIAGSLSASGALLIAAGTVALIIGIVELVAGLISKIEGSRQFLQDAAEILGLVGGAIGAFIGGIGGGIVAGVGFGLESLGLSLSSFWVNVSPFIEGVKGLKKKDFEGIGALSTTILKLTEAEFLDALTKLVGGGEKNLATFGEQLEALGPSLSTFSAEATKVNPDSVQNAANALSAIANISIPASGGFLQKLIGEKDFGNFGTQLNSLGPALSTFAETTSGKDYSGVQDAAIALGQLVSVDIPTVGGIVNAIVGRTDWGVFGSQLAEFGPGFKTFADSVNGIQTNGLPEAASALNELLKIDAPKNEWGIAQIFTGTTNWGTFGTQLTEFGKGFKNFATSMQGVTTESLSGVTPAVDAMTKLLEMDIPKSDGFFQWLVGKKDLGDFGDNLDKLGTGFGTFNTNIGKVNVSVLTSVVSIIERLGKFASNISGSVVDDITNFSTALSLLDESNIGMENVISTLSGFSNDFATSGEELANSLKESFKTTLATQSGEIKTEIDSILTAIGTYTSFFVTSGSSIVEAVIGGMNSKERDASDEGKEIVSVSITAIRNKRDSAVSAGQFIAAGFVAGMNSKARDVRDSAIYLADIANSAFRSRLRIASPSKVMEENGMYFVEGFLRSLQNGSKSVGSASQDMADAAVDPFSNIIGLLNGILDNTIDLQPTIRPVLDLTNIQSGAGQISSIFSQTQTIGLGGYQNPFIPNVLSQIGSNMNGGMGFDYTQNDNSDVIEAIRDLGNEFETIKDAIAQMRVVMDSNALVGQIIDKVDSELGFKSKYGGRRF